MKKYLAIVAILVSANAFAASGVVETFDCTATQRAPWGEERTSQLMPSSDGLRLEGGGYIVAGDTDSYIFVTNSDGSQTSQTLHLGKLTKSPSISFAFILGNLNCRFK